MDVVPIMNRHPAAAKCVSLDMGVLRLYSELSKVIEQDYGRTVRPDVIEAVMRGEETILSDEVKARIMDGAKEWSDEIIRSLGEAGVVFDSYPVVFMGGGSEAFRGYIEDNPAVQACEFIEGTNVNAAGYTKLMYLETRKEGAA